MGCRKTVLRGGGCWGARGCQCPVGQESTEIRGTRTRKRKAQAIRAGGLARQAGSTTDVWGKETPPRLISLQVICAGWETAVLLLFVVVICQGCSHKSQVSVLQIWDNVAFVPGIAQGFLPFGNCCWTGNPLLLAFCLFISVYGVLSLLHALLHLAPLPWLQCVLSQWRKPHAPLCSQAWSRGPWTQALRDNRLIGHWGKKPERRG